MSYSKEIYEAVNRKLEDMKRKARFESEEKTKMFYVLYPRAKEIDVLLSKTAINVARSILNGANAKEQLSLLKENNQRLQAELKEILKTAGLSHDYLQIKYNCDRCLDEGYVDGIMCTCMRKMLRQEAYERLNKLSPLSLSTFECFSLDHYSDEPIKANTSSPKQRMSNIFNLCKKYAQEFSLSSPSLLMQGSTGLGKTHLSLSIASTAINKGYGVIYGSTPNIIMKLEKERFSYNKDKNYAGSEKYLIDCDLLILDDIGTEFATSFSSATVYNIINSRIMFSKPTIVSTNLSMKDLERAYSERLVSRIMGNYLRLEFLGRDIRQMKRQVIKKSNV